jgi:cyanophycin synthetase
MIRIQLDLEALEEWPTDKLPGFAEALTAALPGLADHGCSVRAPGGLLQRMANGTWIGHVVEHAALELQSLAGDEVTRGKTRSVRGRPGVYNVMYAYEHEAVGLAAGRIALELVASLLPAGLANLQDLDVIDDIGPSERFDLGRAIQDLTRLRGRVALGPTTAALVAEARRRGIPACRLDDHSLIRLGQGRRQKRLRASITGETSHIAVETASDKALTKALLAQAGVPTPRGAVVRSAEEAVREARRIRGLVVTKPLDGNHGRGVSVGLKDDAAVRTGFEAAAPHSRRVIVEEQFSGRDYRILVVNGAVIAVAERRPAQVVGDGLHTVAQLVELVNRDPRRGIGHEKVMTRIVVDDQVRGRLADQGLSLDSVPEPGRSVRLRDAANLSTGGEAIDRTDEIHPDNARIARRAAAVVGLDLAGIDFLAPDIARSVHETGGGVVEVNAAPGFRMHLEPSEGQPRDVAGPVLRMLYPPGARSRIPIIAITGVNGKSTTVRMVSHIFQAQGQTVGMTTTSGVHVDGCQVYSGDASGPKSARMVLSDPSVDVAVLETARGGILREGLGFDTCDVGAVLNISPDHLGLKGVETLQDLAAVKSVVTESVARRGTSVLNADDPHTLRMARHAGGRLIWFTLRGGPDLPAHLQKHLVEGGRVVALEPSIEGGDIVILDGERRIPVIPAGRIPATLGGIATFNVANALAATAIAYAQGVAPDAIARALASFSTSFAQNPGRLNVHDDHGFRVILDYAHNPAGLQALGEVIQRLRPNYDQVIGMVSIPGDRRDEDRREMGAIAAELHDHIVFRERPDGHGRPSGEVLDLMQQGAVEAGFPIERTTKILDEHEAVTFCLRMAKPGDLVMILPTNVQESWRQILDFRPEANTSLRGQARSAA